MLFSQRKHNASVIGGLALLVLSLSCPSGWALSRDVSWIAFSAHSEGRKPDVDVLASDIEHTEVSIAVPGLWVEDVINERGEAFHRLDLPGYGTMVKIGNPELPMIRFIIAIPFCSNPTVEILETSVQTLHDYRVFPFQEPTFDAGKSSSFVINQKIYARNAFYPVIPVGLGRRGIWRDLEVVIVEVSPIRFNPLQRELEVATSMKFHISHNADQDAEFLARGHGNVSEAFRRLYSSDILNFPLISLPSREDDTPGTQYLIITHPDFESAIQPLAAWHHRRGLETEVLPLLTASPEDIKDEIENRYDSGDLDYILLVGDISHIPCYYWRGHLSDYWYACITGNPDLYADLAVGRLSTATTDQVENQVRKILTYAHSPPAGEWLTKTMMVAHREDAPGKYVGCKENIRTKTLMDSGLTIDTIYGHEPSGNNANVSGAVLEGRHIVNYRGHGTISSWSSWSCANENWTNRDISSLTNANRTPIVFNIACENHKISSDCLGEAWLNARNGAVASLGASSPSYTSPNHDFDVQLFDAIYNEGIWNIGYVTNDAVCEIMTLWGWMAEENAKMYFWLGDPATEIWTAIPEPLAGTHPDSVSTGRNLFPVTVTSNGAPLQGALVCLCKGTEIHATGLTDSEGQTEIVVDAYTPGVMHITATKHNYLPYTGTAEVNAPDVTITLAPNRRAVSRGGQLSLAASMENNSAEIQSFDAWTKVSRIDGSSSRVVVGPQELMLQPGKRIQSILKHGVPGAVPLGTYTYWGRIGDYPDIVWDEDSFDFMVTE